MCVGHGDCVNIHSSAGQSVGSFLVYWEHWGGLHLHLVCVFVCVYIRMCVYLLDLNPDILSALISSVNIKHVFFWTLFRQHCSSWLKTPTRKKIIIQCRVGHFKAALPEVDLVWR